MSLENQGNKNHLNYHLISGISWLFLRLLDKYRYRAYHDAETFGQTEGSRFLPAVFSNVFSALIASCNVEFIKPAYNFTSTRHIFGVICRANTDRNHERKK